MCAFLEFKKHYNLLEGGTVKFVFNSSNVVFSDVLRKKEMIYIPYRWKEHFLPKY
jgi:hypothetical protein